MNRDKQKEIHELAKQMSEAISTAVEQRYIEDEAKLQAVLIANGWRKASDVAREIIAETLRYVDTHQAFLEEIPMPEVVRFGEFLGELEKKYTESEDTE